MPRLPRNGISTGRTSSAGPNLSAGSPKSEKLKTPWPIPTVTLETLDLGVDPAKTSTLTAHEKKVLEAYIQALRSVAQLIYMKKEVPSGHLYAELCGVLNLDQYNMMITQLVRLKFVTATGFLLRWVGPDLQLDTSTSPSTDEVM